MKQVLAIVLIAIMATGVLAATTAQAPGRARGDYTTVHNFSVEIDGVTLGGFREVSGLTCETEVIEYLDGNTNELQRLPGPTRCGPLALTYPAGTNRDFWDWYRTTIELEPLMKNGAVILHDNRNVEVARWNFYNAYPVKWTGPNLNASSGDIAMETIELSVERIELAK